MSNIITVIVEGGIVQKIKNIPKGCIIRVQDLDVEGRDEDELTVNEDGDECIQSDWE